VTIFITWTAFDTTSAGRLSPFGVLGILSAKHNTCCDLRAATNAEDHLHARAPAMSTLWRTHALSRSESSNDR
jgi:hypothetical protein